MIRERFRFSELGFRAWLRLIAKRKKMDHPLDQWNWVKSSDCVYDLSDFDTAAAKFQELTCMNPIQKRVTANKGMYNTSEIANNLGKTTIRLIEDIYSKDFEKLVIQRGTWDRPTEEGRLHFDARSVFCPDLHIYNECNFEENRHYRGNRFNRQGQDVQS